MSSSFCARFLFPLGAQVSATCGFRLGTYIRIDTDLFDSHSSSYFIIRHTHGPMDFQDSPEAFVKKGIQPVCICFCRSPCLVAVQKDCNDV